MQELINIDVKLRRFDRLSDRKHVTPVAEPVEASLVLPLVTQAKLQR